MAIGKKTGGRRKGVPNKRTAEQAQAGMNGMSPLDYLLGVMRDDAADERRRDYAANAAAPYVHAKLASVEVGNKPGETFKVGLLSEDGGLL